MTRVPRHHDMPSGNGRREIVPMRCADCAFVARGDSAGCVLTAAIAHARETQHTLTYRGKRQDLSHLTRTA